MLISHEVPIKLLEESINFNDYDYCLLHLTYENDEYKSFYKKSLKNGRKVILDNSMYELGDSLTNKQLAEGVIDIKPTEYVIPDKMNDIKETIKRFKSFIKEYPSLPGLKIGVVQGSTIEELIECYKFMSVHADKIAIPFGSKAYNEYNLGKNILENRTYGRQKFIKYLVDNNIWNYEKPHHLLGCNLPTEFNYYLYKKINIESIDTSNPIINGILSKYYDPVNGINEKSIIKMCEMMDIDISYYQLLIIHYNIFLFRLYCNNINCETLGFELL